MPISFRIPLKKVGQKVTVEWQSRLNISKLCFSMNFAVIRLKLILVPFEVLNYEMKPLKSQKVEDFK